MFFVVKIDLKIKDWLLKVLSGQFTEKETFV